MKNRKRGPFIALAALIILAAVCLSAWIALRPNTNEGTKNLLIQVVHADSSKKEFKIQTEADFLGQALEEHKEIGVIGETGEFGLYITSVDGEEASDKAQTYWAISKDGQMLTVGADSQPIADGDRYELALLKW